MHAIQFYIESKKKAETISYYNNKYNKKTTQNTLKNRLDIQTVFLVGLEYNKSYYLLKSLKALCHLTDMLRFLARGSLVTFAVNFDLIFSIFLFKFPLFQHECLPL